MVVNTTPWAEFATLYFLRNLWRAQETRRLHYIGLQGLIKDKDSSILGQLVLNEVNERLWIQLHGLNSQHFIFSVTYECVQEIRMLHYIRLEGVAKDKHVSLLGPFVICEENKLLWIQCHGFNLQHFIFSVTYECVQEIRMIHYIWLEGVAKDKDSSLLGPLVSYEENEMLWRNSIGWIHSISFSL